MDGSMTFRDALLQRLNIIQPHQTMVKRYLAEKPENFTRGIENLISHLHDRGTPVYLVSGGFRVIIEKLAKRLRIMEDRIFANVIRFDNDGVYAGIDTDEPTSSSGGKTEVCRYLKDTFGYNNLVMVGDGMTDLEACPPADAFIGFGGNQVRPSVKAKAAWFVTDFDTLHKELLNTAHSNGHV